MLENRGKRERIIRTLHGLLSIRRTVLRPLNETSRAKLLKEEGTKSIVPIDELLRIDRLPFRITISMMMEIVEEAVIMNSGCTYFLGVNRSNMYSLAKMVTNQFFNIAP